MYYPRLRDLREDKDLTQKEVAAYLGTTQQVYSRYEKGIQEIPLRHFIALAKLYQVSLDYLAKIK
jgi:transcriptional regulator with XRE-family HTH domain